ncbi:hypothetical protein COOONC_10671 [Cooperia oncophora]
MLKRRSADILRIPVYPSNEPLQSRFDEDIHERVKRSPIPQDDGLDPRSKTAKHRKKGCYAATTMYTMTNTQVLPGDGDSLRMKTIRNRVKPISDVGDDEDMLEIDINSPPLVYITKIQKRGEEIKQDDKEFIEKPRKKGKGKGKKKKKKLQQSSPAPIEETTNVPKKQKGHRKKQNKLNNRTGTYSLL